MSRVVWRGISGKSEVPYVIYNIGESMQELIKLWKEYESSQSPVEKNAESINDGPTLEIRIPAKHVITTNHQVRSNFVIFNLDECLCFLGHGTFMTAFTDSCYW